MTVEWESDREYRTEHPCPQCEQVRRLQAQSGVTWTWPATVAFIALLSFIAFIIWMVFG